MRSYQIGALVLAGAILCGIGVIGAQAQDARGEPVTSPQPQAQPPQGNAGGGGGGRGAGRGGQPAPLDPAQLSALKVNYITPKEIPEPADNKSTPDKVALGQKLFFDPGLSGNGKIACATCHDVRQGFADRAALSLGVKGQALARRTPTVINLAWSEAFFWDGRAKSLEQQAVMPIADANEMGMPHEVMVSRLRTDAEYRRQFQRAFPGETISVATVGKAIAAFERTLVYASAPFDRWVAGDDSAISDAAKRGFVDFNTRAGCAQCHSGWNFSDGKFHNIGVRSADVGRFGIDGLEASRGWFKTPGLRNIAQRAPYMHDGQVASLNAVLRFYNRGFDRNSATLSPEMRNVRGRLGRDIVAFLETLTTPTPPELVKLQEALDQKTR